MTILHDPQHWRQRAEEARAMAAQIEDRLSKAAMLTIAEKYEQIARRSEARLLNRESSK
jgi:hypothetical protein